MTISADGGGVINGQGGIIPPLPNLTEATFNNYMKGANNPNIHCFIDINPSQYGGIAPDGAAPPPTGGRPKVNTTLVMQGNGNQVKHGPHDPICASGVTRPDHLAQTNWCHKCSGLHFGQGASACPAGGAHSSDNSGNDALCHL